MKKVAEALKNYFQKEGITQNEVANRLGVSRVYINKVLNDTQALGKNSARKWADEFDFSYAFLLSGEGHLLPNEETEIMDAVAADMNRSELSLKDAEINALRNMLAEYIQENSRLKEELSKLK